MFFVFFLKKIGLHVFMSEEVGRIQPYTGCIKHLKQSGASGKKKHDYTLFDSFYIYFYMPEILSLLQRGMIYPPDL